MAVEKKPRKIDRDKKTEGKNNNMKSNFSTTANFREKFLYAYWI